MPAKLLKFELAQLSSSPEQPTVMGDESGEQHLRSGPKLGQPMSEGLYQDTTTTPIDSMEQGGDEHQDASPMPRARAVEANDTPPEDEARSTADSFAPSTPTSTTTTSKFKSKTPTTSTPKSKKRKSRNTGYADDSDSDYRARTTSSRKSSRKSSLRSSLDSDPDGDYGGSTTPTRQMTRPVKPRYSWRATMDNSGDDEDVDEREEICLKTCDRYESGEMMQCDGVDCGGRKFHPGCVGFRSKPVVGEGRWWFCFQCRKMEGKGMRTNGVYVEGGEE